MTRNRPFTLSVVALALAGCGGAPVGEPSTPDPAPASASASTPAATPAPTTGGSRPASLSDGAYAAHQAERGRAVFGGVCSECHDTREFRGADFLFEWEGSSVGRLYRVITRTMPDDDPGSLTATQYLDVVSYILSLNGFPAGEVELVADEAYLNALTIES
ncbi:MAG: hypothetical protein RQ745_09685 [Longimicrobiales bacterium]|nr:hypothetical protein [Longimicrobiales bacterium]